VVTKYPFSIGYDLKGLVAGSGYESDVALFAAVVPALPFVIAGRNFKAECTDFHHLKSSFRTTIKIMDYGYEYNSTIVLVPSSPPFTSSQFSSVAGVEPTVLGRRTVMVTAMVVHGRGGPLPQFV